MPVVHARAAASAAPSRLRLALRACGFVLLAALVLFAGGFGWFADKVSHMTTPTNPAKADAIIVLTGGQSRLDAAMDLLASGKGERLLISGVHPSATRRQLQVAMGGDKQLFSCCVDIDRAALDTIGNAEESAKWVENHAYGSIIIVTNNYHMPRSLLEMGRLLHGARLEPYPVVNTNLGNGSWLTKPEALRVLLTEYSKYVLSLARGFLPLRTTPEGVALAEASTAVKN
ncbi:YdcF family protein [Mesorhizobium sp. VK25A]|uniref:YdcF family protein n=1 Tax=Mesorhizobium vachelliae TaxID=3072309 RepID=A0ABU5A7U0_9HYPH|nr:MULTISPECIES: YdcF family protein [unclassified Mesorhizobium]MDX8533776.1 YdcF family protein [Mesorhizobium sp. VK25D]MDX8546371.1 YdcF family protein [Mesorhizobium sp. VK25A]